MLGYFSGCEFVFKYS